MSATPGTFEGDELRRLRRLVRTAVLLAVVSTTVAVAAFIAPYNAALRGYLEHIFKRPTVSSQLSTSVVEAERFVVRGKAGQVRAELGVPPDDDRAELTLRAPDGTRRATLSTADAEARGHGASLALYDRSGTRFASLDVSQGGTDLWLGPREGKQARFIFTVIDEPLMLMTDETGLRIQFGLFPNVAEPFLMMTGKERTEVMLGTEGGPALKLSDQEGKVRSVIALDHLGLLDQEGKARSFFGLGPHGEPALALFDQEGKARMAINLGTKGEPALTLADQEERERAMLGSAELKRVMTGSTERTAESSLVLFDKEGRVIFQAPSP
jgi:hypothetical protein